MFGVNLAVKSMIEASFVVFLRTGALGPIEFGMRLETVMLLLGEPDFSISRRRARKPEMLEYGVLEFYFHGVGYGLSAIYADHFERLQGGGAIRFSDCQLAGHTPMATVATLLREQSVRFSPCQPPDLSLFGIRTEGGVELWFDEQSDDPSSWGGLYAICVEGRDRSREQSCAVVVTPN